MAEITYQEAQRLLNSRFEKRGDKPSEYPSKEEIKSRRAFDADDHWQDGKGFIGELPTDGERLALLRKGFSPEPVISEILDTHVENVLGDEPQIALEGLPEAEAETVKGWWKNRKNTLILADALRGARREKGSVLRAFIPSGNLRLEESVNGAQLKIRQPKDLADALSMVWIRSEPIETGGVIVDENTAELSGLFLYKMRIGKTEVSLCEYSYLNETGQAMWGTLSAHNASLGAEEPEPFNLGGHLPIYQVTAKELVISSLCQAQRCVNLSGTMLTRNNNLAGSRERLAVGVEPPGEYVDTGEDENGNKTKEFIAEPMQTGPGTMNFLRAQALRDEDGAVKALANPNIWFNDPVPTTTFIETSEHWRSVAYSKAKQRHILATNDGRINGVSRTQMRKEFQSSLQDSKNIVDPAGSWMIEVALRIAGEFMGQPEKYAKVKATFDAQVSTVDLTPEELQEIRADYEARIIDLRTALELRGVKNVDEVLQRIQEENRQPTGE